MLLEETEIVRMMRQTTRVLSAHLQTEEQIVDLEVWIWNKGDQNNDHVAFEPAFDSKEVFFEDPCDVMTCDDMTCHSCHNQLDEDGST